MRNLIQVLVLLFLFSVVTEAGDRKVKKEENRDFEAKVNKMDDPSSPWMPMRLGQPPMERAYYRSMSGRGGAVWIAGSEFPSAGKPLQHFAWYKPGGEKKSFEKVLLPIAPQSATSASMRFSSISAADDSVAIVGLWTGAIIRTENRGVKWDTVQAVYGSGAWNNGVRFINKDTAIAFGDNVDSTLWVARSLDRGKTWTRIAFTMTGGHVDGNSISADSANKLAKLYEWATGGSAETMSYFGNTVWLQAYKSGLPPAIFKSTDAGATWIISTGRQKFGTRRQIYTISFKDDSVGFVVALPVGRLYKSTDGGITWGDSIAIEPFSTVLQKDQNPWSVAFVPGTTNMWCFGFSTLTGSQTWKSTDGGTTWAAVNTPGSTNLYGGMFASDSQGIAFGYKTLLAFNPSVEVNFTVNTATVPDTLKANSFVQLRGNQFGWNVIEGPRLTNLGGDYWGVKLRFRTNDTLNYKFFTNPLVQGPGSTGENVGWENNLVSADGNRLLAIANSDSLLPLQYVNGSPTSQNMYWSPFKAHSADSIGIFFRVNMQGDLFYDTSMHKVGVRGMGGLLTWGSSMMLMRESPQKSDSAQNFWSGTMYFKRPAAAETLKIEYKFVRHGKNDAPTADPQRWEDIANRIYSKRGDQITQSDTTLYWKWFSNEVPRPAKTKNIIFSVDMTPYIKMGHFSKATDSLYVRGAFNGWSTDDASRSRMQAIPGSNLYSLTLQHRGAIGDLMNYKFFIKTSVASSIKFESGWELPLLEGGGNRGLIFDSTSNQQVTRYYNDVFPDNLMPTGPVYIAHTVKLNFKMDMKPAMKLTTTPFKKGVDTLKLEYTSNEWKEGITKVAAYSDANNDSIYEASFSYTTTKFTPNALMYTTKYTSGTAEGGGYDKGRYRVRYILKTGSAWPAEYTFPQDTYTEKPPLPIEANPYTLTDVKQMEGVIPTEFTLLQNYPNPFNPSTKIVYGIPTEVKVSLRLFNLLGQEVATLVNDNQKPGKYSVDFNATNLSSGIYIYRLEAGSVTFTKKMLLMK
ncbi:MAG: T9SS type A sorting domain-containing protein [Bacteroidetes bacterium]|nr:T9SS type A sorting domain-containing protein [Bacteroidota bacterium]